MDRKYVVTVFGATGFTGAKVLEELLKVAPTSWRIGAAGRSASALQAVVDKLGATQRVGIIPNVDINTYPSVLGMCTQSKLVIACAGPYRLYGEPVVKACVEAGTHYLDVCGEPEFIERMEFIYGEQAAAKGCYVVSACGLDSVPGDWGVVLAQQTFKAPAVPSSVVMYITLDTGPEGYSIHYATWKSAVLGLGSVESLRKMRSQIKAAGKAPVIKTVGPKPQAAPGLEFWADASVMRRTQAALTAAGQPAVHCVARFTLPSLYYGFIAVIVGGAMAVMSRSPLGRDLLLKYPRLFSYGLVSHQGPTEEQMRGTKTVTTLIAKGYSNGPPVSGGKPAPPDREVVGQIVAPDPGYRATSIFITQTALAVLEEPTKLPKPGVHTPGILLKDTNFGQRLQSRGCTVTVVSDTINGSQTKL